MDSSHHQASFDKGVQWLLSQQTRDGAWTTPLPQRAPAASVALTALATLALARCPLDVRRERARAIAWLLAAQREDGSFGEGPDGSLYRPYATAYATSALCASDPERHQSAIRRAVEWLVTSQAQAGTHCGGVGVGMREPFPGGAVYTRSFAHPSTTAYVAEALRDAGLRREHPFWARLSHFFRGLHNLEPINALNALAHAELCRHGFQLRDDGGLFFVRLSGEAWDRREPRPRAQAAALCSTGGTTFQGLIGYLCAGLTSDAPEVRTALNWLRGNYSLTEHAGYAGAARCDQRRPSPSSPADALERADQTGMYQYYRFLAKALGLLGQRYLVTPDGLRHDWAQEIADQLVARQTAEGAWSNVNTRWLESEGALGTVFALLTFAELPAVQTASQVSHPTAVAC